MEQDLDLKRYKINILCQTSFQLVSAALNILNTWCLAKKEKEF